MFKAQLNFLGIVVTSFALLACQPEVLKDPAPRTWTDTQVDNVVTWEHVRLQKNLPAELKIQAPDACNYISFVRFKPKDSPTNASAADAVFLMIPGILEGSMAFKYIARQMIYMAKIQHHKNFEVWAYERRANCLEDHSIMDDIESAPNASAAGLMAMDFYYGKKTINGKAFGGIVKSEDAPYLSEFGLTQTTEDIYYLITTMIPNQTDRKKKLFIGGHSLGGLQTSAFLSWDFDGNKNTLADAGYNNVAGAFAFESILSDLKDIPLQINSAFPLGIGILATAIGEVLSPSTYNNVVQSLRNNTLPRYVSISNFFEPEVIAFPPLLAAIAQHNPQEESFITKQIEPLLSPALNTMMDFFHPSFDPAIGRPRLTDFRYTNEALVALFFDDNFSPFKFLGASIGHLNGGAERTKPNVFQLIGDIPVIGNLLRFQVETGTQYVAVEHNLNKNGPLYRWGNFDEVATLEDPNYTTGLGQRLTTANEELVDIHDLINSLHDQKTNLDLTEWYFTLRIMADVVFALPFNHAIASGFPVYHQDRTTEVPRIEFVGKSGLLTSVMELNVVPFTDNVVMLEGQGHMDPMFEVVNAPSRHTPVVIPSLINFALAHIQ